MKSGGAIMKGKRIAGLCLTVCVLAASVNAWSQTAFDRDGLDTGLIEFDNPNTRPDVGWENDEQLSERITKLTDACFSACHGPEKRAQSPSTPNIAGQKFYYVRKQLELFNENNPDGSVLNEHHWDMWKRSNFYMNEITSRMQPRYYVYIADRISSLPCDGGRQARTNALPPTPPKTLHLCISCHGEDGRGTAYNVPNIAGQSYTYLGSQLNLMRANQQTAARDGEKLRTHPPMEGVLETLSVRDIRALAKYYSELSCGETSGESPPDAG